jgi:hypothetical protein
MRLKKNYYFMLHARLNERVFIDADQITVNLRDIQKSEVIINDTERNSRVGSDSYFYLSGGGSFLIDGRYLLVVKRDSNVMVNPGKISLFTGRSNNYQEWLNPSFCTRELFEELTLFYDGKLLRLSNKEFQQIIDSSYALSYRSEEALLTEIELLTQSSTKLNLQSDQGSTQHNVMVVISESRDINCIFLFSLNISIDKLEAIDCEDDIGARQVYLLDIDELTIKELTKNKKSSWVSIMDSDLTLNLATILCHLKEQ